MNLRAQGENLQNTNPEDQVLDDYSIGNDQESRFFDQLYYLSKYKLYRQFRDRQILIIELLFPLILLFAMFFISSIKFNTQNSPFVCDLSIFPSQPNIIN